jgi:putative membrane protein insertion efficiency factor
MIRRVAGWLSAALAAVLIGLVRVYQATLSPFLGRHCRFVPTCSNYFIEAVRVRGPLVGAALGIWRILRCHPFSRGGCDPVPLRRRRRQRRLKS